MGYVSQLLWLVSIDIQSFFVQGVSDGVCAELIVCIKRMEMLQGFSEAPQVIVDLEVLSKFRSLLQFAEEGQIFTRILLVVRMNYISECSYIPVAPVGQP